MHLIVALKDKNTVLFTFGLINFILAILFAISSKLYPIEISGVNGWYKPVKFALSIGIYVWTMAWLTGYLVPGQTIQWFNWITVLTLGFEIVYIGLQASRGQLSHFNLSTPLYSALYTLMATAATVATLAGGYIGLRFFTDPLPALPNYMLWAIRWGIGLFVVFSLEGFVMGARLTHTIGAANGGISLPFLNWSRQYGDPRVAHFIGMHALQVLPLSAYFSSKYPARIRGRHWLRPAGALCIGTGTCGQADGLNSIE